MSSSSPVTISLNGILLGARLCLAILPGSIALGAVFGTVAAQKGLTLLETMMMQGLVFAGASQFVAMEVYRDPINWGVALAMAGVVAAVNMRMLLVGASLRPWMGGQPAWQVYPTLFVLTDINWLLAVRHYDEGHRDWGVLLGSGLLLWVVWCLSVLPGYFFGSLIENPQDWGLDVVLPAFFAALLVPLWKGRRQTVGWALAGLVATATWTLFGGYWGVLTGALAGAFAGAYLND
ncbi:AzlC family ABC transporter permease [Roseibium limicola]|uniref:AzlC family ABC transporter permease n=1 Tax=Roseibium limicola TaxID=2816037 RepID=A0A939ERJ8_9HYPH|nr:AzlC family ABC transporter permease [Roseibium limicola]MBO0345799.1 AzlC family ABC transporter permease [Roseibium limicola]